MFLHVLAQGAAFDPKGKRLSISNATSTRLVCFNSDVYSANTNLPLGEYGAHVIPTQLILEWIDNCRGPAKL